MSYRHSFHAGNFADVLKHIVLVEILEYLARKEKGFMYVDTHAGAGLFDLKSEHAAKLNEWEEGIGRLKAAEWPELARYFEVIERYSPPGAPPHYPGSPLIAQHFMRPQDRAWLFELHPRDHERLKEVIGDDSRVEIRQADGFARMIRLLPPPSRRGLVLIDPSYELKTDYETVVETIHDAHRRFSNGIYALWYPVVDRRRIDQLETDFVSSGMRNIQRFELGLKADTDSLGMTACGMIVVNPPWVLMEKLRPILGKLANTLGDPKTSFFKCDVLVDE